MRLNDHLIHNLVDRRITTTTINNELINIVSIWSGVGFRLLYKTI
jgi:hypothetical protein